MYEFRLLITNLKEIQFKNCLYQVITIGVNAKILGEKKKKKVE